MSAFLSQLAGSLLCLIFLSVSGATFAFMMIRLKPCERMSREKALTQEARNAEYGKIVRRRAASAAQEKESSVPDGSF